MALAHEPTPINTTEYWKERALKAEERADRMTKRAEAAEELQRRTMAAITNETIPPAARIVGIVAQFGIAREHQTADHEGRAEILSPRKDVKAMPSQAELAQRAGVSEDSVSRSLKLLKDVGALPRKTSRSLDKDTGEYRSKSYAIQEGGLESGLDKLATINAVEALPDRKARGKTILYREPKLIDLHCPKCGSDNTRLHCKSCGATRHTIKLKDYTPQKPQLAVSEPVLEAAESTGGPENTPLLDTEETGEEIQKPQLAVLGYVSTPAVELSPASPLLVNVHGEPQNAVSGFDPDDYMPEPPTDLLWEAESDPWQTA